MSDSNIVVEALEEGKMLYLAQCANFTGEGWDKAIAIAKLQAEHLTEAVTFLRDIQTSGCARTEIGYLLERIDEAQQ